MKRSDLKNGMVVEFNNGNRYLLMEHYGVGKILVDQYSFKYLMSINEELISNSNNTERIIKVYKTIGCCFRDYLLESSLSLIWERKEELNIIEVMNLPMGDKMNKTEILKAIEEKKRELDRLEKELKKCGNPYVDIKNIALQDENFYCNYDGKIEWFIYSGTDESDDDLINNCNAFTNKEYAKKISKKELLMRKLDKFAWDNDSHVSEEDWKNGDSYKYYITCYYSDIKVSYASSVRQLGQVYFQSRDVALKAIEEFEDELLEYFSR